MPSHLGSARRMPSANYIEAMGPSLVAKISNGVWLAVAAPVWIFVIIPYYLRRRRAKQATWVSQQEQLSAVQQDPAVATAAGQMLVILRRAGVAWTSDDWLQAQRLSAHVNAADPLIDVFFSQVTVDGGDPKQRAAWLSGACLFLAGLDYDPGQSALRLQEIIDVRRSGYTLRVSDSQTTLAFTFGEDIFEPTYGSRINQKATDEVSRVEKMLVSRSPRAQK